MRNVFLKKSYTNILEKASTKPFYKKPKLTISLDQQPEKLFGLFLLFEQVEVYQNILTLIC